MSCYHSDAHLTRHLQQRCSEALTSCPVYSEGHHYQHHHHHRLPPLHYLAPAPYQIGLETAESIPSHIDGPIGWQCHSPAAPMPADQPPRSKMLYIINHKIMTTIIFSIIYHHDLHLPSSHHLHHNHCTSIQNDYNK